MFTILYLQIARRRGTVATDPSHGIGSRYYQAYLSWHQCQWERTAAMEMCTTVGQHSIQSLD
jgi:hypothetical protein